MKKFVIIIFSVVFFENCRHEKSSGIIKPLNRKNDSKELESIDEKIKNMKKDIYSNNKVLESDLIAVSGLLCYDKKAFSRIVYELYDNGNLKFEYNVSNGLSDGKSKVFYNKGNLKYIGYFKKGNEDGIFKGWYDNEKLAFEKPFKNGYLNGKYKAWLYYGKFDFYTKF
tara:strand:+ start:759 stop:1265 length:507 start_codon:yes stop_codon:yes gene_type:complete